MKKHNKLEVFNGWLISLDEQQRNKFEYLNHFAIVNSNARSEEQLEKFNLIRSFALFKYDDPIVFAKNELLKACEELTKIRLSLDWPFFSNELLKTQGKIRKNKPEKNYRYDIDNSELNSLLFFEIVSQLGLIREYLDQEIIYDKDGDRNFSISVFRDYEKIIEFMGLFIWVAKLLNITESESYNEKPKKPLGRIPKPVSYEGLFKKSEYANKVKEILEANEITKDHIYMKNPNRSNNDSELLSAFYVLRPLFVSHDKTPAAKCFYKEFGAVALGDRMMSIEPFNKDRESFVKIFSDLLKNS